MDKDKIVSLAREYVENVKCTCDPEVVMSCWRCLFEHNLNIIDSEVKHEMAKKCLMFSRCRYRELPDCNDQCRHKPFKK